MGVTGTLGSSSFLGTDGNSGYSFGGGTIIGFGGTISSVEGFAGSITGTSFDLIFISAFGSGVTLGLG